MAARTSSSVAGGTAFSRRCVGCGRFGSRGCFGRLVFLREGHGIGNNVAVFKVDGAGSVFPGKVRVVGHHNYQPVAGDLFENVHDLNAGLRIQSAGGFVRKDYLRVVYKRSGYGDTLHLSAGHLGGLFAQLIAQTNLFKGLYGAFFPFRL